MEIASFMIESPSLRKFSIGIGHFNWSFRSANVVQTKLKRVIIIITVLEINTNIQYFFSSIFALVFALILFIRLVVAIQLLLVSLGRESSTLETVEFGNT